VVDAYDRDGFHLSHALLSPAEVLELQAETDRLVLLARGLSESDATYDLEPDHDAASQTPRVRRITRPDKISKVFERLLTHPRIIGTATRLLKTQNLRLGNFKLNMKPRGGGSAIHWHQDWGHYPHTNDSLLAVGIFIDDMVQDNGPLQIIPASHTGATHSHHGPEGYFVGGFSLKEAGINPADAVTLLGKAGSCSFHHVRAVHGSDWNLSNSDRRILFLELAAADAWPLIPRMAQPFDAYQSRIIHGEGEAVPTPRMVALPVRMPLPQPPQTGTIYQIQEQMAHTDFGKAAGAGTKAKL